MSKHSGKGLIAACALTKVMSDDLTRSLRIEVGPPAYDPHNNVLYLPGIPTDDLPKEALTVLRAYLAHEAAERGMSTWNPSDPRWAQRPGLKSLVNCLNDARIDRLQGDKYPGAGQNIVFALKADIKELLENNRKKPLQPSVNVIAVLSRYIAEGLMTYDEALKEFPHFEKHFKKAEPLLRALTNTSTEQECIDQAQEIYRRLKLPDPDAPPAPPAATKQKGKGGRGQQQQDESCEPDQESGEGDGEGEGKPSKNGKKQKPKKQGEKSKDEGDEQGEGEGGDEGDEESDESEGDDGEGGESGEGGEDGELSEGEAGAGEGKSGNGQHVGQPSGRSGQHTQVEPESTQPPLDDVGADDHDVSKGMLNTVIKAMFGADLDHVEEKLSYSDTEYTKRMPKSYTFDDTFDDLLLTSQDIKAYYATGNGRMWQHRGVSVNKAEVRPVAQLLETRLRQILTSPTRMRVRQQEIGEVDERNIAALAIGQERVMMRRRRLEGLNVAVSLSWDESGSMQGGAINLVAQLAHTFNESLGRIGILYELLGWTTTAGAKTNLPVYRQSPVRHAVYKAFHERGNSPEVAEKMAQIKASGGTPTGEGLMFAAQRLSRVEASRKILFFLTDGQPEMDVYGNPSTHYQFIAKTQRQCAAAGIEVIGFGIQANIEKYFENSIRIDALPQLKSTVLNVLMQKLQEARKELGRSAA